jgi:hypothetical protein
VTKLLVFTLRACRKTGFLDLNDSSLLSNVTRWVTAHDELRSSRRIGRELLRHLSSIFRHDLRTTSWDILPLYPERQLLRMLPRSVKHWDVVPNIWSRNSLQVMGERKYGSTYSYFGARCTIRPHCPYKTAPFPVLGRLRGPRSRLERYGKEKNRHCHE